jgi:cell division septum initiation protein DivIVA
MEKHMDPEEIENRQFLVQLRGYARDEVEAFREEVAQEIKILRKQLTKATSDLSHANSELANAKSQLAEASAQLAEERSKPAPVPEPAPEAPQAAQAPDRASMFHMVGQETERILLAAEEAAEQIHEQAVKESAELMADTRMRVERSLAEFEAARRAAEEDFAGIRDSRSMVASQLEDIRRRLEETISRLRVPVELPGSKPASRFRPQPDTPAAQPPAERRPVDPQAQRQREMEAARELQARQTAHRGEASRREEELKAVQAEAEHRARAEAESQARERAAAEVAARKAQQAADLHAAVAAAQEADRVQAAREAERLKSAEAERLKAREAAAARARADEESARQKARKEEAERAAAEKAEAEKAAAEKAAAEKAARAEADRAAQAKKERAGKAKAADSERTRKAAPMDQPKQEAAPAEAKAQGESGSSLDELLAEIRRKREDEERLAAQPQETQEPAAAPAAPTADELSRRSEALGDLPAQTARRLKRLLQEEHNDLLDRLRTQRGKGDLEDNLAPQSEQLGRFVAGLSEALGRAFSEGRRTAGSKGSADPSAAVTRLVTRQVLNPLRSEITKAIQAGLDAQDSASSLSERANDVFRVWKGVRTQLLGEGIAYAAYHQGLVDAWGSRAGASKSWVFSDEQDCPNDICRRNADAGAVGLKAPFPSGHLAPPAHGGCTCTLAGS